MDTLKFVLEQRPRILVKSNEPMSMHTSLRVGGCADLFANVSSYEDLIFCYRHAKEKNIPVFILGSGTNLLVGDKGIRGLVIKNNVSKINILEKVPFSHIKNSYSRRQEKHWRKGFLSSSDLYYEEDTKEGVLIEVYSGTLLATLINVLLRAGITGLQWFSGIPGTVGGAIWNNIHGADFFFGEFLSEVYSLDKNLKTRGFLSKDLDLGYNFSCFHDNGNLITSAKLILPLGNKNKALAVSKEWIKRKIVQPKNSAGCTFNNLTLDQVKALNLGNGGAGFVIDKVLGLKGFKIGGAEISDNHANFITTNSKAKAKDVVIIINTIQSACLQKLGLTLKEEIVRVGEFD